MKVIGICGKARSGKDTIAKYLWANYAFTRIAFADPVKLSAQRMFGLTNDQTWSDELKEVVIPYWGMSPRTMFQKVGTEAGRDIFGYDLWIKRLQLTYNLLKDTDDIVIPDVRFDNEAAAIREMGGVIVEVVRGAGLSGETAGHRSEAGLSLPPEHVIDNSGTLDDLKVAVDLLVGVL